jgi:YbbR domain-containing protein
MRLKTRNHPCGNGGKPMRRLLDNQNVLKIISVVAAIIMWLYVMNEQNPQVTYVVRDVPVKMLNLDESKFAIKDNSTDFTVNVKIKGRRSLVLDLKPEDINAEVSLRGRMEGDNSIRVDVTVPSNVELLEVTPREIMVALDAIIEEQMPVFVDVVGTPELGFAAVAPSTKPQAVVVKGPRTMVNAVKRVSTSIDITGYNSTIVSTLPIRVLDGQDKEQKEVTFRPDVVEVTVPIVPTKSVRIEPNIIGNLPEGYIIKDVRLEFPTVMVTGSASTLSQLQFINTEPINLEGNTSTISMNAKLSFPEDVSSFDENIQSVWITIEIERIATTTLNISSREIILNNVPTEFAVDLERTEFILTISGPESIISRVNSNMVKLNLDVSDLTEGEYILKVNPEISSPYNIVQIEPDEIKVTIDNFAQ